MPRPRIIYKTAIESFWAKVEKGEPDQCWNWKSGTNNSGYGQFCQAAVKRWAHRFSYELHHGDVPEGLDVMHSCDNRRCCNPAHLTVGTRSENMVDAYKKGRVSQLMYDNAAKAKPIATISRI